MPAGEISDTLMYDMAEAAANDGRPLIVLTFCGSDPAGWQMPISISRKLQALRAMEFHDLRFQVRRVGLTPAQVREYGLPSTPLKATERRADRWKEATGTEQTEVDALLALRPDLLRKLARDAARPFHDPSLNARCDLARREWIMACQEAVDAQTDQEHLDRLAEEANEALDQIRAEIAALTEKLRIDTSGYDLPEPPPVPEPEIAAEADAKPLIDFGLGLRRAVPPAHRVESLRRRSRRMTARDEGGLPSRSFANHAAAIAKALLGEPNEDLTTKSQLRFGSKGSLAVEIAGRKRGTWFDHETETGGGMLDLIRRERGINGADAYRWLHETLGIGEPPASKYTTTGTWVYLDRNGEPLYRVVRRDCPGKPKRIHQERYDPATGKFIAGKDCMAGVRYVPYRLPDWISEDVPILVAEGERKVDALFDLGFLATCNAGGAGKFGRGFAPYFADRDVVLLPDNDDAGRDHVRKVGEVLKPVATTIKVVELPGLAPKGDIVDWLAAGGNAEQLRALIDAAPPFEAWLAEQPEPAPPAAGNGVKQPEPSGPSTVQGSFKLNSSGVHRLTESKDGENEWVWVSSPIEVAAETRNAAGESWGRLLRIPDRDGIEHIWAMPMGMLAGDGVTYRERLLSLGAELAPGKAARDALHNYLTVWRPERRARCVERTGWHGQTFVLPDQIYGANAEETFLQAPGVAPQYDLAGSLAGWQSEVAALAVGNTRLVFAISVAFAAALLYPAQEESGGCHFHGASSTGKTSIGRAAASVWGTPQRSWRTTANAAEALARGNCDALLFLDEIGQAEPWVLDALAYMLGNEAGKARMRRDATARETLTWRTLFLSTGEVGLLAKLIEIGRRPRAGQSMRLIEIPADAGAGLGCFEQLHGQVSGDALARHLKLAADQHKGHAARAFVDRVAAEFAEVGEAVTDFRKRWVAANVPAAADGQALRAAGRFGLIAAAGELARGWGILPWPEGEAERAASTCFRAWLATRGGTEPQEIIEGLAQVRQFIEEHGNDRFERAWEFARTRSARRSLSVSPAAPASGGRSSPAAIGNTSCWPNHGGAKCARVSITSRSPGRWSPRAGWRPARATTWRRSLESRGTARSRVYHVLAAFLEAE